MYATIFCYFIHKVVGRLTGKVYVRKIICSEISRDKIFSVIEKMSHRITA